MEHMKKQIEGFSAFIREQGVVGLAVGFLLGGSVSKVVSSLVEDVIQPLIGLIVGSKDGLTSAAITVGGASINYGNFLSVLLDFFVVAAVVYFVIKGLKLDKLDKKKETKSK